MSEVIGEAHFETVNAAELPPGKLCHITEHHNRVVVQYLKGEASEELIAQLNAWHVELFGAGRGAQTVERLPACHYVRVPAVALPIGRLCNPVEGNGEFVWQVCETEMTAEACEEMNKELAKLNGGGFWVRRPA